MMKVNLFSGAAWLISALALSTLGWAQDAAPKPTVKKFGGVAQFDVVPTSPGGAAPAPATGFGGGFGGGATGAGGGVFRSDMVVPLMKFPVSGAFNPSFVPTPDGPMRTRIVTDTFKRVVYEPIPPEELQQNKVFHEAMQGLRAATKDDEKKAAIQIVSEQLVKQFDNDLAQREKELANVEARLKSLREQLEKRKVSKDEIVKLRLQTIVNNAEGLGFPDDEYPTEVAPIGTNGLKNPAVPINSLPTY